MNENLKSSHSHPALQVILLLVFAVLAGLVCLLLGVLIYAFSVGFAGILPFLKQGSASGATDINLLRVIQISSTIGIFILGPICYAKVDKYKIASYFKLKNAVKPLWFVLTFFILLSMGPFIEYIGELNKQMYLPQMFSGIEEWMKLKEIQAAEVTKLLLQMKNNKDFFVNMFMIAILPAIGEELLFRGALQHIFFSAFKNIHWAIFITAVLFSAMHIQFFGFFPRLFLGVLFGYILYLSNSLWVAMFAHFLNNGIAVAVAYRMQLQGKKLDEVVETSQHNPIYLIFLSLFGGMALLYIFYKNRVKESYAR